MAAICLGLNELTMYVIMFAVYVARRAFVVVPLLYMYSLCKRQ